MFSFTFSFVNNQENIQQSLFPVENTRNNEYLSEDHIEHNSSHGTLESQESGAYQTTHATETYTVDLLSSSENCPSLSYYVTDISPAQTPICNSENLVSSQHNIVTSRGRGKHSYLEYDTSIMQITTSASSTSEMTKANIESNIKRQNNTGTQALLTQFSLQQGGSSEETHSTNQDQARPHDIMSIIKKFLRCNICKEVFNSNFMVQNYTVERNKPMQCHCSCVICLTCYRENRGCPIHHLTSYRAPVCALIDFVSSDPTLMPLDLQTVELDHTDIFMTEAEVNQETRSLFTRQGPGPDADNLQQGMKCPVSILS